jgi:hypothetical protein
MQEIAAGTLAGGPVAMGNVGGSGDEKIGE